MSHEFEVQVFTIRLNPYEQREKYYLTILKSKVNYNFSFKAENNLSALMFIQFPIYQIQIYHIEPSPYLTKYYFFGT